MPKLLPILFLLLSTVVVRAADGEVGEGGTKVVVHKAERLLEIYKDGKVTRRVSVALGGDPIGQKHQEGDERTPEGHYVLDWRNPNSGYHKSLHISYPDAEDRADAKAAGRDPGGMVMIHGQRNYFGWFAPITQMFDWTNGCIAVNNEDMDAIWETVPNGTPIEILP